MVFLTLFCKTNKQKKLYKNGIKSVVRKGNAILKHSEQTNKEQR